MLLTATIAPKRAHNDTNDRETRDVQAEGTDYDSAKTALQEQVPEGWGLLFVRQVQ